ncbi:MAG: hypothetical protein AAFU63_13690 [Pseudomonadota bacterium]
MERNTTIGILLLAGAVMLNLRRIWWRRTVGRSALFASDAAIEDSALSAITGQADPQHIEITRDIAQDGPTTLRPMRSLRMLAPAIAALLLYIVDIGPALQSIGITGTGLQHWLSVLIGWMLVYASLHFAVFHKLSFDDTILTYAGFDPRTHQRRLDDLVEIACHPARPALVLTFAAQRRLYIPNVFDQRDRFIADMAAIAAANRARGLDVPAPTLAARLGF